MLNSPTYLRPQLIVYTHHTWSGSPEFVTHTKTKLHHNLCSFTKAEIKNALKIAKDYFESQFIQSWLIEMLNKPKLRTYITFKDEFKFEKYLYVYRWHKPVIPEKDRTCKFCLNGQIENEKHSFSDCFLYTNLCNLFQSKILSVSPEVWALNKHEICIALMQTTNIDLRHPTAKFIYQITNRRNDCLLVMTKSNWALHLCCIILHLFMTLVSLLFSMQVCILIQ